VKHPSKSVVWIETVAYRIASVCVALVSGAAVAAPSVERFEAIVNDASTGRNDLLSNSWGLHQPRITSHADGSIRLLYLSATTDGTTLHWNLMKREPGGGWWKESMGVTNDDVALLRDGTTDKVHVLAWPGGLPATHTSPHFEATAIPGEWQYMGNGSRHYGNAGIGSDGTVCLKVSR
jgi:hypothetical protein